MAWVVNATPRLFYLGKDPVPIVHEAGWPQGRSGQVRGISPRTEFGPRTFQLVAKKYVLAG